MFFLSIIESSLNFNEQFTISQSCIIFIPIPITFFRKQLISHILQDNLILIQVFPFKY